MKTGQNNNVNYVDVKKAFEGVYECLDLRCEDVGGIWDSVNGGYLSDAAPCGSGASDGKNTVGICVGLSVGGGACLVALLAIFL
jgi:hypothetical protein